MKKISLRKTEWSKAFKAKKMKNKFGLVTSQNFEEYYWKNIKRICLQQWKIKINRNKRFATQFSEKKFTPKCSWSKEMKHFKMYFCKQNID